MKNWDAGEWIFFMLTGIFGAFLGLALSSVGWLCLATAYDIDPWVGWLAVVFGPLIFCVLFLAIHILRNRDGESFSGSFFSDRGDALLFSRRLATILALPLVIWILWELFVAI